MLTIYHNPRCKKSREGLKYLNDNHIDHKIINYIKGGFLPEELSGIVQQLKIPAFELIRTQEVFYQENLKNKNLSDNEWIEQMIKHPNLIKRPLVVNGNRAVLAQPPEKIKELF
jgi:arsenate reductase (glutaredoxin)